MASRHDPRRETATSASMRVDMQRLTTEGLFNPFASGMFGRDEPFVKPEPVEKPQQKETKVVVDDEYLALSESVGVDSPIVADELLKRCLKQQKVFVYNTAHVEKYLKSMFTNNRQRLVWSPLRQKDQNEYENKQYDHAVPGHALQKAEKVLETFDRPNDLCFEVSDYEDVKPDPFLSVRIKNSDTRFVIAYWDEPNFRMEE